jgi:hypothetical protein
MSLNNAPVTSSRMTDNKNMAQKTAVRLHFLRRYHTGDARVFDCCQGSGLIWKAIRKEFEVSRYWGVDLKTRPGGLKMDSVKVLSQGVKDNVIDVDTYGEPWAHWLELLPRVKEPTTVFLTWTSMCSLNMSDVAKKFVFGGQLRMPPTLFGRLWDYANQSLLAAPIQFGLRVIECQESVNDTSTRYIGIHLRPTCGGDHG